MPSRGKKVSGPFGAKHFLRTEVPDTIFFFSHSCYEEFEGYKAFTKKVTHGVFL